MPGGGVWYVAPGQVTEDSELAMMLMNGLVDGGRKLDPDRLCYHYGVWYDYGPFAQKRINQVKLKTHDWWENKTPANRLAQCDWKRNTSQVEGFSQCDWNKPNAGDAYEASEKGMNYTSLSNGALARCMPFAIWGHKLALSVMYDAVTKDVNFTHCSVLIEHMTVSYIAALKHLLNNPTATDRRQKAFNAARGYVEVFAYDPDTKKEMREIFDEVLNIKVEKGQRITREDYDPSKQEGLAKHAFILAMHFLTRDDIEDDKLYNEVMWQVASLGGDTDTNCCIVGSAIGAYLGLAKLP